MIKNIPNAIIKIPEGRQDFLNQKPVFEVLIKQDNKVIYHNKTYAVVMNLVQSVTKLNTKTGELEGDSQVLGIGHPIVQLFALDQLKQKMRNTGVINDAIRMIQQIIENPELKEKLAEIAKKASIK